jgi:uncharacterized protein YgbK (DUF1537 family)
VSSSYVPGYFTGTLPCGLITMETVKLGPPAVTEALSGLLAGGTRVVAAGERTDDALPRLRAFLADLHDHGDFLLIRPSPEIVRGSEAATAAVLADLGRETLRILGRKICGILLSGGDTAAMFFEGSGTASLAPGEEIQPLMMGGRILDGEFAGLAAVTKGGLIGEEDGIYRAVQWLRKERN